MEVAEKEILFFLLFIFLFIGSLYFFYSKQEGKEEDFFSSSIEEGTPLKEGLGKTLEDLKKEKEMGRIPDEDYEEIKEEILKEWLEEKKSSS